MRFKEVIPGILEKRRYGKRAGNFIAEMDRWLIRDVYIIYIP